MAKRDYYEILGIEKNASKDDIKKAFRKMAMEYHPDRQAGKTDEEKKEAEEKFKELNEAAEVLMDDEKRQAYDNFGHAGVERNGGTGHVDPYEFFRKMHGFDGDPGMFGRGGWGFGFGRGRRNDEPQDGGDISVEMQISFEDAVYGADKIVKMGSRRRCSHCDGTGDENKSKTICPVCGGSGMEVFRDGVMIIQQTCRKCGGRGHTISTPCHVCGGSGIENIVRDIAVKIEPGSVTGNTVLIKGEGSPGRNGGRNGDMVVVIKVKDSDLFESVEIESDKDLMTNLFVDPVTASIGGKALCPTPYGECEVTVPPGVQTGKLLKLRNNGLGPAGARGNLYAQIIIEPFAKPTAEQRELLEKLAATLKDFKKSEKSEDQARIFREYLDKVKARK